MLAPPPAASGALSHCPLPHSMPGAGECASHAEMCQCQHQAHQVACHACSCLGALGAELLHKVVVNSSPPSGCQPGEKASHCSCTCQQQGTPCNDPAVHSAKANRDEPRSGQAQGQDVKAQGKGGHKGQYHSTVCQVAIALSKLGPPAGHVRWRKGRQGGKGQERIKESLFNQPMKKKSNMEHELELHWVIGAAEKALVHL